LDLPGAFRDTLGRDAQDNLTNLLPDFPDKNVFCHNFNFTGVDSSIGRGSCQMAAVRDNPYSGLPAL
jgi:hypothetical protein